MPLITILRLESGSEGIRNKPFHKHVMIRRRTRDSPQCWKASKNADTYVSPGAGTGWNEGYARHWLEAISLYGAFMKRRYDLFVSYSSLDRRNVEELVGRLSEGGLSVWYDQWEMKPGDRLRDRIHEGIRASRYFLVVLSENSITAPWVRLELDSAMLRELEAKRVVVIPVVIGAIDVAQIPPDLRGKHYLDLRDLRNLDREVCRLLDLFDLEHRRLQEERRAILQSLRAGLPSSKDPVAELRRIVIRSRTDYTVQKAALAGLTKIATPPAMLVLAERMLDLGGMEPLEYCIKLCIGVAEKGGLFLLSATLFYDSRYISEKLDAIKDVLRAGGMIQAIESIGSLGDAIQLHREPARVRDWSRTLGVSPQQDVAQGTIFGAQFDIGMGWQRTFMETFTKPKVDSSRAYAEQLIPGICNAFTEMANRARGFWVDR